MKYTVDKNGYVTFENIPISKSGVFPYTGKQISPDLEPDKIYMVWRPEEELNNPETMESFELTPWIPYHEMIGDDYSAPESVGVQGITGAKSYYKDGTLFLDKLRLFGRSLKESIKSGMKELSCGFGCSWTIQSGRTPNGEAYDVIQRDIFGNHLASVPEGRMGSEVSVAMDRAVVFALDHLDLNVEQLGDDMELKELIALAVEQGKQIKTLTTAMDGMSKDMKDMKDKAEDADKEKSAEDEEAEKKKAAEDKEKEAKDEEKSKAMDSAIEAIATLTKEVKTLKSNAMDGNAVMKAYAEKQTLANQVSAIVGAFDHADMDAQGVAKYGLEKMGVACDAGLELAMMKGILHTKQSTSFTVDHGTAQDAASDDLFKGTGL